MSRSYRHNFCFQVAGDKSYKKLYNRMLRRASKNKDYGNHSSYKKCHESWNISDMRIHYLDEEDFVRLNLPFLREGQTEKDLRKIWRRHFLSK